MLSGTTSSASAVLSSAVSALSPTSFPVVSCEDPAAFAEAHFHGYKGDSTDPRGLQFSKGTTTLAFKFQGGVVVSVDSRSTQGSYIGAAAAAAARPAPRPREHLFGPHPKRLLPLPIASFAKREEDH